MKKIFSIFMSGVAMLGLSTGCSEIEDGVNDIDSWEIPQPTYDPVNYDLSKHPCMLHTQDDINYVKASLSNAMINESLQLLKTSGFSNSTRQATARTYVARLDANNWAEGGGRWVDAGLEDVYYNGIQNSYMDLARDAAAAYQLGLLWVLEGDSQSAECAIKILNDWAAINHGVLLGRKKWKDDVIDSNEYLTLFQIHQIANAAELLRGYNNWGSTAEFSKVVDWLKTSWYSLAHMYLEKNSQSQHWFMNWDLAAMSAILSIGILAEDNDMVNEAILHYKQGTGPGNINGYGCIGVYDDPDGTGEKLAQGQEAGRDQGHNVLCAVMMGTFCQMAYNIGEDLFAFNDHRAIAFAEYIAKYNIVKPEIGKAYDRDALPAAAFRYPESSLPYTAHDTNAEGHKPVISGLYRGEKRPGWDIWASYCKTHGVPGKYVTEMADHFRADGGAGHYGTNSGGFDQLGFSTLMHYRE